MKYFTFDNQEYVHKTVWDAHIEHVAEMEGVCEEMAEEMAGVQARCCGEYPDHPETLAVEDALARYRKMKEAGG